MNEPKLKKTPPATAPRSLTLRRRHLQCSGILQTPMGAYRCTVNNISRGGANLRLENSIEIGGDVSLTVPGFGTLRGYIVWQDSAVCGMRFVGGERVPVIGLGGTRNSRAQAE